MSALGSVLTAPAGPPTSLCSKWQSLGQAAQRTDTGSSWNEANRWSFGTHGMSGWGTLAPHPQEGGPLPGQGTARLNLCFSRSSLPSSCKVILWPKGLCDHLCHVPSGKDPGIFVGTSVALILREGAGIEAGGEHLLWKWSLTPNASSEVCPRVADSPVSLCL